MTGATGNPGLARDGALVPRSARSVALPKYGLLLVTLFALLALQGFIPPRPVQQVIVTALAGLALLLSFRAARLAPRLVRIAAVIAGLALAAAILRALAGGIGLGAALVMNAVLVAAAPPAVAVGVVRDLRSRGQVRIEAVMGVLSFYILMGFVFGFIYGAMDQLGGDPFFASGVAATTSRCIYFSFTTLATVGYGDLTARTDAGHTLCIFEMLIGQIYLVTVVSLIVSNLGGFRR